MGRRKNEGLGGRFFISSIILLFSFCSLLTIPILAEERESIELPEVVITGEDRSLLDREKKEEILFPEREKMDLEKESAKALFPEGAVKHERRYLEEKVPPSSFEIFYGSYNSLDYEFFHKQRIQEWNYLINVGGASSGGFDWREEEISSLYSTSSTSRHSLKGEVYRYGERWGIEGVADYGIKNSYLPYQRRSEAISAGGIRLGGVMTISPKIDLGIGIGFGGGDMRETNTTSTSSDLNLEFNTLVKELPVGIGVGREDFSINSKRIEISNLFIQSKDLNLHPFSLDARVGIDHHHHGHNQELNLSLLLSFPWRDRTQIFLGCEKGMKNLSFEELYLETDYVTPNKDLRPVRMGEIKAGGSYRFTREAFFNLLLFVKDAKDYIVLEDEDRDYLYRPTNIDASIWGAQIEAKGYLTPYLIQNSFLVYTTTKGDQEGKIVPFIPNWKANLLLKYFNGHGLEVILNPEYVGQRQDGLWESTRKELPGYLLVHAHLAQSFLNKNLTLFLYGKNLLAQNYLERWGYPGWPCTFGGGFNWKF
ncbi:TPA: hypothetical protein DCX15_02655 [bacterium]|nr:hypothetical protein [bacterium]